MEKLLDKISFKYSDPEISKALNSSKNLKTDYSIHFDQNEDEFIKCGKPFRVPSFAIHHDLGEIEPSLSYLTALRKLVLELSGLFPDLFRSTKYYFDPSEILKPCFVQVLKVGESYYLYLIRLDLDIRITDSRIINQATNDKTAEFETEKLFIENMFIPIHEPSFTNTGGEIPIRKMFESTWIGETGTGYHINGHWVDREITKMLSSLYLPENLRTYPYYPLKCDFNTVCLVPPDLSSSGRKEFLSYLHKTLPYIKSNVAAIEKETKNEGFSKDSPVYIELKKKILPEWTKIWSYLKISPYLNENDMREYSLEFKLS